MIEQFLINHEIPAAIIAALVMNGWVVWVTFQAFVAGLQANIAAANARMQAASRFDAVIFEDKMKENEYGIY